MAFRPLILLGCILFLLLWVIGRGYGQTRPAELTIRSLPEEGVLLEGWRFQPGDNPAWAAPSWDDSDWEPINPALNIEELTPLRQAGVGWFRLHLRPDPSLAHQVLVLLITQQGASEIYLQGKLLHRLGVVSSDPAREVIYNPNRSPLSFPLPAGEELVLAVRYSFAPPNFRYILSDWLGTPALVMRLQRLDDAAKSVVVETSYTAFKELGKVGYFFALGLLHLVFFLSYPRRRTNLYFCLALLGFALSYLCVYYTHHLPHQGVMVYLATFVCNTAELTACLLLLLCAYIIAQQPLGWLFVIVTGLMLLCLPFPYLLPLMVLCWVGDAVRVSWRGIRRRIPDSRLSMAVWAGYIFWSSLFYLFFFHILPPNRLLMDLLFNGGLFWLTGLYSVLLSREYGRTNRALAQKLKEVQRLSEQMWVQEEEKQQRLASENARLEELVTTRTGEIRDQNRRLASQAEQLREQDQLKSRFVTNLTHEFRTPLALILAPVEKLLSDSELPPHVGSLLTVVKRNAWQLLALINQLLDLSKLDAGQMKVALTRVKPVEFVDGLVTLFRPQAEAKAITLTTCYETAAEYGRIDTDKWTKIITNVLSNAVKYTLQAGQVRVQLRVAQQLASLTITDTGVGIGAEKLPRIFDRFYQADDSTTRMHEGSGIGLALVKELTDLLGGTVTISSEVGRGTTVQLALPVEPADPNREEIEPAITGKKTPGNGLGCAKPETDLLAEEAEEKNLVLVVEDNAELRAFISQELAPHYRVLTADNGLEAWNTVRQELPDLVVSDVMMPMMDGIALTGLIKSDSLTSHIAVVLLTARTAHESRLEGLTYGADEYLTKPFHTDELRLRLGNLLTRRQQLQHYFQHQLTIAASAPQTAAPEFGDATNPGEANPFIDGFYQLIEARLDDSNLSVEELASEMGMSRRTLHRKLKALTNLSPQEVMFRYRLRRAADLLRQGRNVSETAYLVGYESPSHFSTMFKSVYRQIPSEFAKQ